MLRKGSTGTGLPFWLADRLLEQLVLGAVGAPDGPGLTAVASVAGLVGDSIQLACSKVHSKVVC